MAQRVDNNGAFDPKIRLRTRGSAEIAELKRQAEQNRMLQAVEIAELRRAVAVLLAGTQSDGKVAAAR